MVLFEKQVLDSAFLRVKRQLFDRSVRVDGDVHLNRLCSSSFVVVPVTRPVTDVVSIV